MEGESGERKESRELNTSNQVPNIKSVGVRVGNTQVPDIDDIANWTVAMAQDAGGALGQLLQFMTMMSQYTGIPILCDSYFKGSTSFISELNIHQLDYQGHHGQFALHIPQSILHNREYAPSAAIDSIASSVGVISSSFGSLASGSLIPSLKPSLSSLFSHHQTSAVRPSEEKRLSLGGKQDDKIIETQFAGVGVSLQTFPRGQEALRDFRKAVSLLKRSASALCCAQFTKLGLGNPYGLDPFTQLTIVVSILSRLPPLKTAGNYDVSATNLGSHDREVGKNEVGNESSLHTSSRRVQHEQSLTDLTGSDLIQHFLSGEFHDSDDNDDDLDEDFDVDGWEQIDRPILPHHVHM